MSIDYNILGIDTKLVSADQIVHAWKVNRRSLAKHLNTLKLKDPWNSNIPISIKCRCKVSGQTSIRGVCMGCNIISKLFTKGLIVLNKRNTILVGQHTGLQFVINQYTNTSIEHGYIEVKQPLNYELIFNLTFINACEPNFTENIDRSMFYAFQGSYHEHYALISSFIEYEMDKNNIPCLPTFKWIWNCCDTTNIVEEISPLSGKTFDEFTSEFYDTSKGDKTLHPEIFRGILGQLLSLLHFLLPYAFIHGAPSISSVSFSPQVASYIYDTIEIASPITLHINPTGVSSISMSDRYSNETSNKNIVRLYHPGLGINTNIKLLPNISIIPITGFKYQNGSCHINSHNSIPCTSEYMNQRVLRYRLGNATITYTYYTRYLGIPLFNSSFDLYAFLISFMVQKSFYNALHEDTNILQLWKTLFTVDEYDLIMVDIQMMKSTSYDDILQLLSKYALRCDAITHMWNGFKTLYN